MTFKWVNILLLFLNCLFQLNDRPVQTNMRLVLEVFQFESGFLFYIETPDNNMNLSYPVQIQDKSLTNGPVRSANSCKPH